MQNRRYRTFNNNICCFILVLFQFFLQNSDAQESGPYACFGYVAPKQSTEFQGMSVQNSDTLSEARTMILSPYQKTVLVLDSTTAVLAYFPTNPYQLLIFISPDPHEQKYPNLSPYSTFADNPLLCIDPDGRDIILRWGGVGGYQNMTYTYQENRTIDDNLPTFVKSAILTLDHLYAKKAMNISLNPEKPDEKTNILEKIMTDHDVNIVVMNGKENQFTPSINMISFNGFRGIEFRKDVDKLFIESNTGRNSAASLFAHELIHAYNKNYDTEAYEKRRTTLIENFSQKPPFFPNEEEVLVTLNLANQVNQNLGEDLRTNYKRFYYLTEKPISIAPRVVD